MVQIILLSQWFSKKTLIKKTKQKDLVKMVMSKLTCPKWHFGQVGHGGKTTIWKVFLPKILVKMACESI
jgi:hypothetical protein